jgi:parallel beta-helix repeat protein
MTKRSLNNAFFYGFLIILFLFLLSPFLGFWALKPKVSLSVVSLDSLPKDTLNINNTLIDSKKVLHQDDKGLINLDPKLIAPQKIKDFEEGAVSIVELNRIPTKSDLLTIQFRKMINSIQKRPNALAVYIQSGRFTIPTLANFLNNDLALLKKNKDYFLNLPLIIGPEASLTIDGVSFDHLILSSNLGAFVLNFGELNIVGSHISSYVHDSPDIRFKAEDSLSFRSFITSLTGSSTYIEGSFFENLGFSHRGATGVSFMATKDKYVKRSLFRLLPFANKRTRSSMVLHPQVRVLNSHFSHLWKAIYLSDVQNALIYNSQIHNSLNEGIHVSAQSKDIFIYKNKIVGSQFADGLKIDQHSSHIKVVDNDFSLSAQRCVSVFGNVTHLIFYNNQIHHCQSDGMLILDSLPVFIANNFIHHNNSAGLRISFTKQNSVSVDHLLILNNQIFENSESGINLQSDFISNVSAKKGVPTNLIKFNIVKLNHGNGIKVDSLKDFEISYNSFLSNNGNGFSLSNGYDGIFYKNSIAGNYLHGFSGENLEYIQFRNNTISKNSKSGIFLKAVTKCFALANNISENKAFGFFLTEKLSFVKKIKFFIYGPRKSSIKKGDYNLAFFDNDLHSNQLANIRVDQFDELWFGKNNGDKIDRSYFWGHLNLHWREISLLTNKLGHFVKVVPLENW